MVRAGQTSARPPRSRPPRDWGKALSRLLCALFACVGLIPLSGGLVLRSPPLQRWAAAETSRVLDEQLGVTATFAVEIDLIPLRLAVTDLVVPASDGLGPAVSTQLASISPRFFSLLAGRLDVGDIELEESSVRLVVRDGQVTNVHYRLPKSKGDSSFELERSPFRSLTVTNARFDIDVEGTHVRTDAIDLDAFAEPDLAFDVALRMAGATLDRSRERKQKDGGIAYDEDRLCALDLRVLLSRQQVSVRRFSLLGAIDLDPLPETRPGCDVTGAEKLAVRLSQLKITPRQVGLPLVRGRVFVRAPAGITNRFVGTDLTGWVGFSGEVALDGTTRLPEVSGQISGEGLSMGGKAISKRLTGTVEVAADVVRVPKLEADWANGTAWITDFKIEPFAPGIPYSVARVESRNMNFPGLMRDINVTRHTIVDWNYDHVDIEKVKGTVKPFVMAGSVDSRTSNFTVYNKGFDDPARSRMIGVKNATLVGHWRANGKSLDFYDVQTAFGNSRLPVDLVSLSFGGAETPLIVRLKEGAVLDLADVGPIASLEVAGVAKLGIGMNGPMAHPSLDGTLSVNGLMLGGFEAGDLHEADVHFEPLFVEFKNMRGTKRDMKYRVPTAKLDFDGPATVAFSATAESDPFVVRDFFHIFHFDEDPRFAHISGHGKLKAGVRYVLGGPEDACETGRLSVSGHTELSEAALLGERYSGAQSDFAFEWFDIDAGIRGFRLDVPSVVLRKGSGTLFGRATVQRGGAVSGHFVATRVPISHIDVAASLFGQADGFVTGAGRVEGRLEQLAFTADLNVSEVRARGATLPSSELHVSLVPKPGPLKTSGKLSACGRPLPPVFDELAHTSDASDASDGEFRVSGELFGKQLLLQDLQLTSQRNRVLSGKIEINKLDLGALVAFSPGAGLLSQVPRGMLSGSIDLARVYLKKPFDSRATLTLRELTMGAEGFEVGLTEGPAVIELEGGAVTAPRLALALTTPSGQRGILDGSASMQRDRKVAAKLILRETSLGVLVATVPGIARAEGRLTGGIEVQGALSALETRGFVEVQEGRLVLAGLSSAISNLSLRVDVDQNGIRITRGEGDWGGGKLNVSGGAPLTGGTLGTARARFVARQVSLPWGDDVRVGFNADLDLTLPASGGETQALPRLSGDVELLSASFERAMTATADITSLTGRGHKTEVDAFETGEDGLELDVVIRGKRPLTVKNALVECALELDPGGLRISGTNRRFGAVGNVEVVPGGRIFLRRNAFEVKSGLVRFNDPTRLRPEVDVSAVTDFRRFEDRSGTQATVSSTASNTAGAGGSWHIRLRAYGPPDDLRVDLTSDPPLAQDDIFLLLTVGLTRTELDQARSAGVGSSVALEALGSLSGAESAVTQTVPIDEFRFGSVYSARSGRTEPTVTIGKRLSERMRASVTTSLSDTNEVRSNIEYRATGQLSVEGSYDNAQRAGAPALGNLGGDVRWRLEFD